MHLHRITIGWQYRTINSVIFFEGSQLQLRNYWIWIRVTKRLAYYFYSFAWNCKTGCFEEAASYHCASTVVHQCVSCLGDYWLGFWRTNNTIQIEIGHVLLLWDVFPCSQVVPLHHPIRCFSSLIPSQDPKPQQQAAKWPTKPLNWHYHAEAPLTRYYIPLPLHHSFMNEGE